MPKVRAGGPRGICRASARRQEESEGHGGVRLLNLAAPPKLARAAPDPPTRKESCLLGISGHRNYRNSARFCADLRTLKLIGRYVGCSKQLAEVAYRKQTLIN